MGKYRYWWKWIIKEYYIRKHSELELINARQNRLFKNGKIHEIRFENNDKIYVRSTCEELKIRLLWYTTNKASQIYKLKKW